MTELTYPFDPERLLRGQAKMRRELGAREGLLRKKIAVLGGSTTDAIVDLLDLFLLGHGIKAEFYQSEYAQYWQDALFGEALRDFSPDIIYIHTTSRNISALPTPTMAPEEVESLLEAETGRFAAMWQALAALACPIIQNNFERPDRRLLGNRDVYDVHGAANYIQRLNGFLYAHANASRDFYIHDVEYLAAEFGLDAWHDAAFWYRYKYAMSMRAMPRFAHSLAGIIKALYGLNKKALVLDLDNTLWGGVVGDDGVENLKIGPEMPLGQAYSEFQQYVKAHTGLGVVLTVCSKNDESNARAGLAHPDSVLSPEDFAVFMANWENKDGNIRAIAATLDIGADSLVFVDDNPAERAIVKAQVPGVAVPEMVKVEEYIRTLDHNGYFEVVSLTGEDAARGEMYKQNAQRAAVQGQFKTHHDFLRSLEMQAVIGDFAPVYLARITQLTNKSNQFNLTTRRYTESEMRAAAEDPANLRLAGRLRDRFGDNGVVSVVIGRQDGGDLHLDLWLMSCRVLKRDMELAMLDALAEKAAQRGIKYIYGYYLPTPKNGMVKDFYPGLGFSPAGQEKDGSTSWRYEVAAHTPRNTVIEIIQE